MYHVDRQKHLFKVNICVKVSSTEKNTRCICCKIYLLELFGRAFGYRGDVLELEELRVALSDEDLDRVSGRLLRQWSRLAVHIDRRHSYLILVTRLQ